MAKKARNQKPKNWMLALETNDAVLGAKKKFLNSIRSSRLYHWHSFLLAARLAVKNAPNRRAYRSIFDDIVQRLKEWFDNVDWDKWLSVLWEVAKVVIPILVLLIL